MLPSSTRPALDEGRRRPATFRAESRSDGPGAEPDVVLLVPVLELGDGPAADEDPEAVGDRADGDAEVAGPLAVDRHLDLGLAERERGVEVGDPARLLQLGDQLVGVLGELRAGRGPTMLTWNVCDRLPPWNCETSLTLQRRSG